jgi:hypothetical protein
VQTPADLFVAPAMAWESRDRGPQKQRAQSPANQLQIYKPMIARQLERYAMPRLALELWRGVGSGLLLLLGPAGVFLLQFIEGLVDLGPAGLDGFTGCVAPLFRCAIFRSGLSAFAAKSDGSGILR